jgi:hypothetical protein
MIRGTTSTGFEFTADNEQINNAEFLEDYVAMMDGNTGAVFRIVERVLGKEQKKELHDHIRDERGNVPVEKLNVELGEIFAEFAKNPKTKN